jgi:thiamine biosynthesis lipoprotein
MTTTATPEATSTFGCFGSRCAVFVIGDGRRGTAAAAVERAKRRLLVWHERLTRFDPASELSRLNADPRARVPVSPVMARFVEAAIEAAERTGGLVDATLLTQLETAGYRAGLEGAPLPLELALRLAPARRPAAPARWSRWRKIEVDTAAGTVTRPPGVRLDSGGLAKGLFADLLADELATHASFAIDCAGDLRVGGAAGLARDVHAASPFGGAILHTYAATDLGVATSGIGARSWLDADLRPAHHLLDPATGRPAFTGVVQATALAPTAFEAELRAKAAVLSGPGGAATWLPQGGVVVLDDGRHIVLPRTEEHR